MTLFLRQGLVYPANAWTLAREASLRAHTFAQRGLAVAFDEAYATVLGVGARRDRLDGAIVELAATREWAPVVGRLACLRGVGPLTAFGLAVEIARRTNPPDALTRPQTRTPNPPHAGHSWTPLDSTPPHIN